jgi:acyl-CoA reductase-like NAD-dependent aldehyde dehydrogenase
VQIGGVDAGALRHNTKEDIKHCVALLDHFSHLHADYCSSHDDGRSLTTHNCREPSGAIAAIMPSQNPLCSLAEVLGPALAYGNTVVAIIPSDAPLSALQFASLVHRAGFPKGTINMLTGIDISKSSHLAVHADINRVQF